MGGPTPRKRNHGHGRHPSASHRHGHTSDYDSDAAHHLLDNQQNQPPPPNPALFNRTNTELNLGVLRRYIPSIHSILSIAANAVVYSFVPATSSWERAGIEGTYFLCFLQPDPNQAPADPNAQPLPRACIFILNRRGLENTVLDLSRVADFEVMDEIYIFSLDADHEPQPGLSQTGNGDGSSSSDGRVVGVWIHAEDNETRMANAVMIQETMRLVRAGHAYVEDEVAPPQVGQAVAAAGGGAEAQAQVQAQGQGYGQGRRLSVSDLFGVSHNGISG